MKKSIVLILLLSIITILITVSMSMAYSITYMIKQLTANSYDDANPQINNNEYVVWGRTE